VQDVVRMSSSVQVDDVSQLGTCVMETTTAETTPMNRTVPFPRRRLVCVVAVGVVSPFLMFSKKITGCRVVFLRVSAYKKHVNGTKCQYNICRRDLQVNTRVLAGALIFKHRTGRLRTSLVELIIRISSGDTET